MWKLKLALKKHLGGNVADIFLIGSSIKDKLEPRDIDVIVLFREKPGSEDALFEIRESAAKFFRNIHVERVFPESMLKESVFLTMLHEGFSIRHKRPVSMLLGMKSVSLFSFKLENLKQGEKVRFAQALYGRKGDGLLSAEGGMQLGQGSFMVAVEREEIFRELMKKWGARFSARRAFVNV